MDWIGRIILSTKGLQKRLCSQFFMIIQWAAQDYDSLNWFIILRVSFDTSNFVRDLKLTFFTILGFIYTH